MSIDLAFVNLLEPLLSWENWGVVLLLEIWARAIFQQLQCMALVLCLGRFFSYRPVSVESNVTGCMCLCYAYPWVTDWRSWVLTSPDTCYPSQNSIIGLVPWSGCLESQPMARLKVLTDSLSRTPAQKVRERSRERERNVEREFNSV